MKILVVRPDAIGDVVLMIPMLNSVKKSFPKARLFTLQKSYTEPLLNNHPAVEKVLLEPSRKHFFSYVRWLKSFHFDAVILSYCDGFYASLMWAARIPIRIGDNNKVISRIFLNRGVVQPFRRLTWHETQQNTVLLDGFLMPIQRSDTMDLYCEVESEKRVAAWCLSQNSTKKWIGIHPTTGGGNRAWTAPHYARLISLIYQKTEYEVVLTGSGKKDASVAEEICARCDTKPKNGVNQFSLDELKSLIKRCDVFIGTDTGPTHMAAALQVPVICISPTKFVKSLRWGPWGVKNKIVGHPDRCEFVCNPHVCCRPDCLDAIRPEEVFENISPLLNATFSKKKNLKEWISSSLNSLCYFSDPNQLEQLKEGIKQLESHGLRYYLASPPRYTELLKKTFPTRLIWQLSENNPVSLLAWMAKRDINVVHLYPFKHVWKWRVYRQLLGPFIYCPPVIMKPIQSKKALIQSYEAAF